MTRILSITLAIFVGGLVASCSPADSTGQAVATNAPEEAAAVYRTMSIDELAEVVADPDRAYTVVNVHIPYAGEIEGTDYNIAFNDIDALTTTLPDKDATIILYCRSGNMSEQASRELVELGYTQVYDVPGGMVDWQSSGRTLVDNE